MSTPNRLIRGYRPRLFSYLAAVCAAAVPVLAVAGVHVASHVSLETAFAIAFFYSLALELLGMAVFTLVPLPPLAGWRLLELASTGSIGWQRAREYLVEKNLGVLALLILLILPLGGSSPLLIVIVDRAVDGLLGLVV